MSDTPSSSPATPPVDPTTPAIPPVTPPPAQALNSSDIFLDPAAATISPTTPVAPLPAAANVADPSSTVAQGMQGMTPPPAEPTISAPRGKERVGASIAEAPLVPESKGLESAATAQTPETGSSSALESERAKELEPEIEKTIEKMKQHKIAAPEQVAVAADTLPHVQPKTIAQPVIVLPLTEKTMEKGKKSGLQTSIRWLYEWCARQVEKFSNVMVVYRDKDE